MGKTIVDNKSGKRKKIKDNKKHKRIKIKKEREIDIDAILPDDVKVDEDTKDFFEAVILQANWLLDTICDGPQNVEKLDMAFRQRLLWFVLIMSITDMSLMRFELDDLISDEIGEHFGILHQMVGGLDVD